MDGFFDAEVEGIGDECVAYGDFVEMGYVLMEIAEVVEVEVVSGVESESALVCNLGGFDEGCYGSLAVGSIEAGITLGVEFDAVGACCGGVFDHVWISIDEDGDAYAAGFEFSHDVAQE